MIKNSGQIDQITDQLLTKWFWVDKPDNHEDVVIEFLKEGIQNFHP